MSQSIFFQKGAAFPAGRRDLRVSQWLGLAIAVTGQIEKNRRSLERRPGLFLKCVLQSPTSVRYPLKGDSVAK